MCVCECILPTKAGVSIIVYLSFLFHVSKLNEVYCSVRFLVVLYCFKKNPTACVFSVSIAGFTIAVFVTLDNYFPYVFFCFFFSLNFFLLFSGVKFFSFSVVVAVIFFLLFSSIFGHIYFVVVRITNCV